ncbi:pyrroloquinoline quinone biosynthesis protein PqqB [Yoonia sediminilitoris]|uniref:Coenzyme PQQ synthesis protein B n=1 Tax=Yoonia sediminilitoris TaxID=1286148 RepID=A0A2T6KHD9_9RHOB|nr:pyrroloquinoline quinone biosynthesis protein PqqB [Yoonia sediminilitoris]PUB14936.1 pyrroloquinoline quinone biosynthesis protein B [Yoonia sediminilitoris]RCW95652.1 pyrroloquinoline quinone biosynthesis protein B [Yoonia sediminilitoris]
MVFRASILGAAAGGGLPQWNCGCQNCNLARRGEIPAQSQSSVAVSANGADWAILNASPDIRDQMARTPPLHPTDLRVSPLKSVLLTNGDIDHVAGLLTLREQQPFNLFATHDIHEVIAANPIFSALKPDIVIRRTIALNQPFELVTGVEATLFAVPGKVPLYLEGDEVQTDLEGEQTVGVHLKTDAHDVFYIPGCSALKPDLRGRLDGADMVMFDGTLWQDDEMLAAGLSQKTGNRMGHMSMSGPDGSMAAFDGLNIGRKVYVHMNNSNPVLRPASDERAQAEATGWTIAQDGMEIAL